MSDQPVFGVTGWKNSGKTTLVSNLISELTARGLRVSSVKHAHHTFDVDHEGRDSYRHRESGANEVAVISGSRVAIMQELRGEPEPRLVDVIARLTQADIVLVEGYKREPHPKIECRRKSGRAGHPLAELDPSIVAIASDDHPKETDGDRPHFNIDDIRTIADFIVSYLGLVKQTQMAGER